MDTFPIPTSDEAEIERRLLARAVAEARDSTAPSRPDSEVHSEMLEMIARLDTCIQEKFPGITDPDELERLYKAEAVAEARSYKGTLISNDEACAEMQREIAELDLEIAALLRQ